MTAKALQMHLEGRSTTVCRLWRITRVDGVVLGFTDHDLDLSVDGLVHRAGSGLTARALQQSTGLSVDNSEAVGALSDPSISEEDLVAGRYDGAEVRVWLVNWASTDERQEIFRGSLGEISRKGAEFRAELRGLSEPLNHLQGIAYTRQCSAVLGDPRCRFDLSQPGYFLESLAERVEQDGRVLRLAAGSGFDDRWFEGGRCEVLDGDAAGLSAMIKSDRLASTERVVELWQAIRAPVRPGDSLRLTAGCDKRAETCRIKFGNFMNFRGFPQLPGDDWVTSFPRPGQPATGRSLSELPGGLPDTP